MIEFFHNHKSWNYQTLRLACEAAQGGGEMYEIWRAVYRLRAQEGDMDAWWREWTALGDHVSGLGREAFTAGARATARARFFRAANYYRQAEFYMSHQDPRKLATWETGTASFRAAGELGEPPLEFVNVPYEGTTLPGYVVKPAQPAEGRRPAVIFFGGADSTKEELYYLGAGMLAERGMICLAAEGPGQGEPLRRRQMYTRPDFEVAVRAAVDYLLTRPDVDPDRIGLVCCSMGGYYGARAAAFEPRLNALVLYGACYDVLRDLHDNYPPIRRNMGWITGSASEEETRDKLGQYNLQGILHQIKCPVLISHGTNDGLVHPRSAQQTYDELQCPKELKWWTAEETGSLHCHVDNPSEAFPYMYDWMAARLGNR